MAVCLCDSNRGSGGGCGVADSSKASDIPVGHIHIHFGGQAHTFNKAVKRVVGIPMGSFMCLVIV